MNGAERDGSNDTSFDLERLSADVFPPRKHTSYKGFSADPVCPNLHHQFLRRQKLK